MSLKSDLADALAADARLMILKELAGQTNGRLSDLLIRKVLDLYGIARDRDWITTQLRKLEVLGAVELTEAGSVLIALITRIGRDHLEERLILSGVTRPADADL